MCMYKYIYICAFVRVFFSHLWISFGTRNLLELPRCLRRGLAPLTSSHFMKSDEQARLRGRCFAQKNRKKRFL
jgi:hypothetical protein